jgi:hypothetical protein
VRYLQREGLLTPGYWFTLRLSQAGRETGAIRGAVLGDEKPERVILAYLHRSCPSGEWGEAGIRLWVFSSTTTRRCG